MSEHEKKEILRKIINFYSVFQKEVLDIFPDSYSELSPLLYKALQEIYFSPDITPSILSKRLAITIPNTSRALHKLFELGYVNRIKDESDKRIIHVMLTKKGTDLIENSRRLMDELLSWKLGVLDISELVKLSEAFSTLEQLFEKIAALNPRT